MWLTGLLSSLHERSLAYAASHAATLAILFYRMLKFGQDYLDRGTKFYEQRQRDQQLQYLQKKAAQLGFQVVALPQTPK